MHAMQKIERQVKVLVKNLAIFFLCPNKQFLPISFQIQLLKYFPQKQKKQRQKIYEKGTKYGLKFAIPHKIFIFRAGINSSFPADRARRD
jgi:hypothetical protein